MALSLQAEVVTLHSGQVIKGDILLNNEEVVILRTKDGRRYQYPQTEVASITAETSHADIAQIPHQEGKIAKVATQLVAVGGTSYIPHHGWGATAEAHLRLGTRHVLNQPIFLGGSVGYRGVYKQRDAYSWIPLQFAFQAPITTLTAIEDQVLLGASFGYAFATNPAYKGGLCAGVDVGMLFRLNPRSAVSVSFTAQWQQAYINITETIHDNPYTHLTGCSILSLGLSLGIHF